jgi:hypothetical protein
MKSGFRDARLRARVWGPRGEGLQGIWCRV